MKKLAALLIMSLIPNSAIAAPFGIIPGTKISGLKIVGKRGSKTYIVQVPEPNPNFNAYGVTAVPPHGVCAVFAQTKAFSTWAEAKDRRDYIVKLLTKYGNPSRINLDASYEMLSNIPPADAYGFEWRNVPTPLSTVTLDVVSAEGGLSVRLAYFYRNMKKCQNWEPKQDKRGL